MNPWIFWLEAAAVVVLLYFVVLMVDSIYAAGAEKGKTWFRHHIEDDFQYPLECKVCSRIDCVDCPVLEKEENEKY